MRLETKAFAAATGLTLGLFGFLATLLSLWLGGGNTIGLLSAFYPGYDWSVTGTFLALVWGFLYGLLGGWVLATLYSRVAARTSGRGDRV